MGILFFLGIMVIFIIIACTIGNDDCSDLNALGAFSVAVATIALCFSLIALISISSSISSYGELQGIRDSVLTYERTAREVKDAYYVNVESIPKIRLSKEMATFLDINLENLKQSTNVSNTLIDLRDVIVRYNIKLGKWKSNERYFLTRLFMVKVPEDLKKIIVTDSVLKGK